MRPRRRVCGLQGGEAGGRVWRPRNLTQGSGLGGVLEGRLVHAGRKPRSQALGTGGNLRVRIGLRVIGARRYL